MPEEQFIQMYVRDFATMASRVEAGSDIEAQLNKRISETRSHAALMDARKAEGEPGDDILATGAAFRSPLIPAKAGTQVLGHGLSPESRKRRMYLNPGLRRDDRRFKARSTPACPRESRRGA